MLKRIILLEPDFGFEELIAREIEENFPEVHLVSFSEAYALLVMLNELTPYDLIITEQWIPLVPLDIEAIERAKEMINLFPNTLDWKPAKGGEILVDCLRQNNITNPVIIYSTTFMDEQLGSKGRIPDSNTVYCEKVEDSKNLVRAIRKIASKMIKVRRHPCL